MVVSFALAFAVPECAHVLVRSYIDGTFSVDAAVVTMTLALVCGGIVGIIFWLVVLLPLRAKARLDDR